MYQLCTKYIVQVNRQFVNLQSMSIGKWILYENYTLQNVTTDHSMDPFTGMDDME